MEERLREVVVTRSDEKGYGLTVSGESPVVIQEVKEGGPASIAGVQAGDCIIKVNGTTVSKFNHREVVQIIKSSHSVRLTVCAGGPLDTSGGGKGASTLNSPPSEGSSVLLRHSAKEKPSAPQPVNNDVSAQFDANRFNMLKKMLEEPTKRRENIMKDLQKNPARSIQQKLEKELDSVHRQISTIESQLKSMKGMDQAANNITDCTGANNNKPQHCRAKSSPEAISTAASTARHREVTQLISADSLGELSSLCSGSTRGGISSLLLEEPPGTPPPPYAASSNTGGAAPSSNNSVEVDESEDNRGVEGGGGVEGEDEEGNYYSVPEENASPGPTIPPNSGMPQSFIPSYWPHKSILSMEDDEFSDQEQQCEDHGPFKSLSKLLSLPAYLAVFMNYVVSNCDPANIFFYLITEMYKEGGIKEMKKWAYEIHSTFLYPGAPLPIISPMETALLHEIDETLRNELDKEEILRKVFLKARQRAREVLNDQLADFRAKRTAGLGNIFGPPDQTLHESISNKAKETAIVEELLVPFLESVSSDDIRNDDPSQVMLSSLATILWRWFGVRCPQAMNIIDKCPLYVNNKDRPLRSKFFKPSKKQLVREHCFNQITYYSVIFCNHCQDLIWGVAPQGYQCANCEMNIHKQCAKSVEEQCIGQVRKKPANNKKLPSFLGKIIPEDREAYKRKSSQSGALPGDRRKHPEDDELLQSDSANGVTDKSGIGSSHHHHHHHHHHSSTNSSTSLHSGRDSGGVRRAESLAYSNHVDCGGDDFHHHHLHPDEDDSADTSSDLPLQENLSSSKSNAQKKKSGNPINRSESYKDKHQRRRNRDDRRKHSDPSIPTSKAGDVDVESGLHYAQSPSSSSSSLSQSLDSPSLSQEAVTGYSRGAGGEESLLSPQLTNDSDIEADTDLPDWAAAVPSDQLSALSSRERKRQDTINELFHTEQTHVRLLKVMYSLFYNPLKSAKLLTDNHLKLLFPNLEAMLEYHKSFNESMKRRRQETPIVTTVADILSNMFEGAQGEQFEKEAALFVRSQSIGLEGLKLSKKRDQKLASFLQERENHPLCRRLQLKDMLPAGFQRLSKYPLLLESLLTYTDLDRMPEEYESISRCLERSREILASVNAAVREVENQQRLVEIQKRLDQSAMLKNKHSQNEECRGLLDLTKHKLIHEGPLTWRLSKGQKCIDLHVLILDAFTVLLQKDNDKYLLKNFSISKPSGKDDKLAHSPIVHFGATFFVRDVAIDKNALFIISGLPSGAAQIYEFVCSSVTERKIWFKHFAETQATFETKEGKRKAQANDDNNDREEVEDNLEDGTDQEQGTDDATTTNTSSSGSGATSSTVTAAPSIDGGSSTAPGAAPPNSSSSSSSTTTDPPSPDVITKKTGRRLQEVQIIQIVESTPLISPSEVTVSQGLVLSAQPVLTPIELLRRKDIKIQQSLQEKQDIISDILGIKREHFETLGDMAGEAADGTKEQRELVLGIMYQANCLQQVLNEALTIRDSDIVAAKAGSSSDNARLPLYPAPMHKLISISGSLNRQLNCLLNKVTERDDERDRMRKELVASRERLHQLHQNTTPVNSRPSSMLSTTSSAGPDDGVAVSSGSVQEELSSILNRDSASAASSNTTPAMAATEEQQQHKSGDVRPSQEEEEEASRRSCREGGEGGGEPPT